jgi:hypothetical protein
VIFIVALRASRAAGSHDLKSLEHAWTAIDAIHSGLIDSTYRIIVGIHASQSPKLTMMLHKYRIHYISITHRARPVHSGIELCARLRTTGSYFSGVGAKNVINGQE